MRISEHPIIESYHKGKQITFTFDGKELTGYEGDSIAAALKAAGVMVHREAAQAQRHFLCHWQMYRLCHDRQRRSQCADLCHSSGGGHADPDAIRRRAKEGGLTI